MSLGKKKILAQGAAGGVVNTDNFAPVTYTGNDTTNRQIDVDFKPDFIWLKNRSAATNHILVDSTRGANNLLFSDATSAALTTNTTLLSSINDSGFTVGYDGTDVTNGANNNYVAWCWKAGDHDDSLPQINTEGTIDSVVSVNDAAGFSIVKYTGNDLANATIGHGLSSTPELYIIKKTSASSLDWQINLASSVTGTAGYFNFNTNAMYTTFPNYYTSADSQVLSTNGTSTLERQYNNQSADYIAYCFTSISGYQKVGSYTGTGTVNNQINVGFRPRFVMQKRSDSTGSWNIIDNLRGDDNYLSANLSNAEGSMTASSFHLTDTGFTLDNSFSEWNASGGTYIYLAIA